MLLWSSVFFLCIFSFAKSETLPYSCDSPVYCHGDLLHTVQMAHIYDDSKTFVDLKMINSLDTTLQNFETFKKDHPEPNKDEVKQFVIENFEEGRELSNWTLPDFQENPSFIQFITNGTVKNFTQELIKKWPELARHVKDEVIENQEQYSLIPVPNGFIVPGGRFREYYYWDSYWIIDGLVINQMTQTARGMIDNFISLVERFGFVPNGGRVYYLQRSQPPLLTPMAYLYYHDTQNVTWLKQNIGTLAKELKYWVKQTVTIQKDFRTYTMAHYNSPSLGPRPESYSEDIKTADFFEDEAQKQETYIDLKGGGESGWDFSARWIFDDNGGNVQNLSHIQTRRVIPVDLNAFLCGAFRDISELYRDLGDHNQSTFWEENYIEMKKAIHDVLWDEEDGVWYDYDLNLKQHRRYFYPSGVTPLWAKCFDESKGPELGKRVLDYLLKEKVLEYLGGIPASDDFTGEQWDFPNAWPPLQDIVVRGLQNSGYPDAQKEAEDLAKRWVSANIIGYHEKGVMFEKYDAVVPGQYGEGGEYEVQAGFGWSNGVALRFIHDYYAIPPSGSSYIKGFSVLLWTMFLIIKMIS